MLTIKQAHPSTLRRLFLGRERDRENEYKSQSARRFVCLSNYDIWLSLATWSRTQQNGAAGSPRLTRKHSHPEKFKSGAGGHVSLRNCRLSGRSEAPVCSTNPISAKCSRSMPRALRDMEATASSVLPRAPNSPPLNELHGIALSAQNRHTEALTFLEATTFLEAATRHGPRDMPAADLRVFLGRSKPAVRIVTPT
jgi:hypothetical protein